MKYFRVLFCFFCLYIGALPPAIAEPPVALTRGAGDSAMPSLEPQPIAIPDKSEEIRGRYALGLVTGAAADLYDDHIIAVVLAAYAAWDKPLVRVAWYAEGKKAGLGVLAVGESRDGKTVTITRPGSPQEAEILERELCFPTSPTALCRAYLENEVTADDDFRAKA